MNTANPSSPKYGNPLLWILAALAVIVVIALLFDFRLTDRGELPEISASVEGGRLPQAEIKGPDVSVTTRDAEVTVPKVSVEPEKVDVPVPSVDVTLPQDK